MLGKSTAQPIANSVLATMQTRVQRQQSVRSPGTAHRPARPHRRHASVDPSHALTCSRLPLGERFAGVMGILGSSRNLLPGRTRVAATIATARGRLWLAWLMLSAGWLAAQTEVKVWTRLAGSSSYDEGYAAAVDGFGNGIVAGATQGALGAANAGRYDLFVAKYDPSGHRLWLRQRGSSEREFAYGVAADPAGNLYVTGYTGAGLDGNASLGGWDIFLMKFDSAGNWQWTKQDGASQDDEGRAVATDQAGNIFITGYVRGDFHGIPRVGSADVFVSKYNAAGTRLWSALLGAAEVDESFGITCDHAGNVFVTGWTDGSIEGNPYQGNGDNFLAKYSPDGQRLWLRQWGTPNKDTGYALATDAAGNIYVAGYSTGPLYGTPQGNRDVFLAKFDPDGHPLWGRQFGTAGHDQGWGLVADPAGNLYVAGETGGPLDGNEHQGELDVFVSKYDAAGNRLWTTQWGTTNSDKADGLAITTNAHLYVAGWTYGNLDGNTNQGLADAFLTRFAPASTLPPPPPTALPATGLTSTGFTANWLSASGAGGYRLDVSTNAGFSTYLSGYQNLDVGNALSRSLTGLTPGTTYYYRVRAYNAHGASGNSATVPVTTSVALCTPATLLNGSFEGPDLAGVGTNWVAYLRPPYPASNSWTIQTANPPPGAGSRYQQIALASAAGGGGVRQVVTGCAVGATYVISGWMRGNSAFATCRVKCSPTASTDWATAVDLNPPQVASTNGWVAFSGTIVATGTNLTLWLDGQTGGTGLYKAACFDGVTVACLQTPLPLRFHSLGVAAGGEAQLALSGTPGAAVTLLHSSNLSDWLLLTNLPNPSGTLEFTDPSAVGAPRRFYRATSP